MKDLLVEFNSPEEIIEAAKTAVHAGYKELESFSPIEVKGFGEIVGERKTVLPRIVFCGGVLGACTGYCLQFFCNGIDYPLNVGARPLNSVPAFIPITFELTILFASFAAFLGLLFLSGMPRLWLPLFDVDEFAGSTKDGFFILFKSSDPLFEMKRTRQFIHNLKPKGIYEVAH